MYAVYDGVNKNPVAYHDKKSIIKWFIQYNIPDYPNLYYKKIKKKNVKYLEDLYLVEEGNGYLPAKYLDFSSIFGVDEEYKDKSAKKHLIHILGSRELSKKDKKSLSDVILLLDQFIETEVYTLTLKIAKELEMEYEKYKYSNYKY